MLTSFLKSYSQEYEINLSPEGKLETIYDNQGNQFKLKDILINAPKNSGVLNTTNLNCSTTSYFNLYFEPGCGMEDTTNPIHNVRRAVMCKVFEDISNFITSPLSTTGNKVNIWVRNIANLSVPSGTLGLASSYYLPTPNVGGILDGEIWKTIHLGVDSYTNVLNGTNNFYHGSVSFNFNDPSINWNTNLSINSPSNLYDLYTVILHEVVHSLGFNSFINQNGNSIYPFPYYTRYDTFLRTNNNIPLLTIGSCSMYDVSFNSAVSPTVLRPGCTLPNNLSTGVLNNTTCANAIKYVGSSTVPVYTPTCFEQGSSLSHFEDLLYPTCASPYGNDNYFVLSNVNLLGTTKRYLKPEERNVLCDIGYNVKTTFGVSTTSSGFYNYGGTACAGISVAGLNDGINSNGDYTFVGNASTNISINGATILNNDVNATGFECLQDTTAPATLSGTSGTSSTTINFSSATTGLHVLRYVPVNGTKRGNITYLYVYIRIPVSTGGCSPTPSACNLVSNGNFEQISNSSGIPIIKKACGWDSVFQTAGDGSAVAKYFSSTSNPTFPSWNVPCNWFGSQSSNNNIGNSYAGLSISTGVGGKQHIYTRLNTPLLANTNYQLSFDVSLADGFSHWASNLQAFLHRSNSTPPSILAYNSNGDVSIVNNASDTTTQLISPTVTRNTNGWDTVTFNFTTTTGGEQFLYLGLLNNATLVSNTPAATGIGGCNYQSAATNAFGNRLISYYIDNVSLIPTNGAVLNLPASICNTQNLSNLSLYLNGTTATGVFSGTGVTLANGVYSFNASVAGVGTTTIAYTFTNSSGCSVTLYDTINVTSTSSNTIVVDALNDDFSNSPINPITGGITGSVYTNDLYNSLPITPTNLSNTTVALVTPISIAGATINSSGNINIPAGTPAGTYTLTYKLSNIGNCNITDTATVTITVLTTTPPLVFALRANNSVDKIGIQSNGKIIIMGNFTTYNNISKKYIARLNTDLTLDQTFSVSGLLNSTYTPYSYDFIIQPDDKIILVGRNQEIGYSNGTSRGIVRLNANGSADTTFNNVSGANQGLPTGVDQYIRAVTLQPDGKILVGTGSSNQSDIYFNGTVVKCVFRLLSNGVLDNQTGSGFTNYPYNFISNNIQGFIDRIVYVRGTNTSLDRILVSGPNSGTGSAVEQPNVFRLLLNGSLDTTFSVGNTGSNIFGPPYTSCYYCVTPIQKIIVQTDGKILIAGSFNTYNGVSKSNIVRLFANGTIDNTFTILPNRAIKDIEYNPADGSYFVSGEFTTVNGIAKNKIIKINSNGNLINTFNIGTGTNHSTLPNMNSIRSLKLQSDGKLIIGGYFDTYNQISATNITRIQPNIAGSQLKNSSELYVSEPEIDSNDNIKSIAIYPNPSKGIYTIDLSYEEEATNIAIYNVLGELVYNQMLTPQTQNQIDLTHLANGYYIARINNESRSTQQKLIKN